MSAGFAVSNANVAGVGVVYALANVVTFQANAARDAFSEALPSGGWLDNVEIQLNATAGAPTTMQCFFTWDAAGDIPAIPESDVIPLVAGQTTAALRLGGLALRRHYRMPTGGVAGRLHMFLRVNAGTVTVQVCRLHFTDHVGNR